MSEQLKAPEPEDDGFGATLSEVDGAADAMPGMASGETGDLSLEELRVRAREAAEAEYFVGAVMQREEEKAAKREQQGRRVQRAAPIRQLLAVSMLLLNAYLWMGNPHWLEYRTPKQPPLDYYEGSWRIAVYMQRQRVEEFRAKRGLLPVAATQAGPPVKGVKYRTLGKNVYELRAGNYVKQIVYRSTDSLSVFLGRSLVQLGLIAGGVR